MSNKFSVVDAWDKTAWYKYEYVPELWDADNNGTIDTYATKSNPRFTPDLIIVNIGTNDSRYLRDTNTIPSAYANNGAYATVGDYNKNVFKTDLYTFINDVRDVYNNPKIILCYGMMTRYTDIMSFYDSIVNEYNTANSGAKVSTYFFDGFDVGIAGKLDDSHPDKYAHEIASETLISEVKEVMGWERVTDDPLTTREPARITLVPNAAGDKFTLPSKYDKVIVGDTIVIPYGGGKGLATPETSLLKINGVKYSLQPLWKASLYLYGTIGGTTYTATASGCYVSGQGSVNGTAVAPKVAHTNATTGWASGLVFEITQTGTYKASNTWFQAYDSSTGTYWVDTQLSRTEIMEPFTAVEVATITFVDKSVGTVNHDRQIKVDVGSTVTVPKKYATGYKFYSNAACTREINLATATFNSDSTVYVMDVNDVSETPSNPEDENVTAQTYFYPEYPEYTENGDLILPRDYDYEVYVNDGAKDTQIPVYNASRNKSTFVANADGSAEEHRRFSEFSFDGEVTVKIKVKGKMTNYVVMPVNSVPASDTSYDASTGIISVTLRNPQNIVVRLNDDDKTNISIFAEELWSETEIPTGSNVRVFEPGYHDMVSNGRGVYTSAGNETWYLKPGAIINARFRIASKASNVTISGRGSFIDPRTDRNNHDLNNFFFSERNTNVTLEDVKFLDAHCFNLCFTTTTNLTIDGLKILSSEISTDGITFWGDCVGTIKNVFMYINDNAFVVGGSGAGSLDISDCIVGNGHAIFYIQGAQTSLTADGIDIFKMADLFVARENMLSTNPTWSGVTIKNVRAEEVLVKSGMTANIIYMQHQGTGAKSVTLQNISLPANFKNVSDLDNDSSNFTFTFKDVFVNRSRITSKSGLSINSNASDYTFSFQNQNVALSTFAPTSFSSSKKTASHTADPAIIVGQGFITPYYKITKEIAQDSTVYVPVAYILKNAGYEVKVENNGAKVTATDDKTTVVLTETSASNTTLTDKPKLVDGILMVPTSLMYEVYGLRVGLDANGNVLVSENITDNLIKDGGFENISQTGKMLQLDTTRKYAKSFDWLDFNFGHLYRETTNVLSGNYAMKVGTRADQRGVAQNIGEIIKTHGTGTYTFSAYVKLGPNATSNTIIKSGMTVVGYNPNATGSAMTGYTYDQLSTTSWTKLTRTVTFTEEMVANADKYLFAIVGRDTTVPKTDDAQDGFYFYVDDVSLTVVPTATKTIPSDVQGNVILPKISENESKLFKGWYDSEGNAFVAEKKIEPNSQITLTPVYIDATDALTGKINPDGNATTTSGDSTISATAKFSNGLYYQGIQIRMTEPTGLRFIFAKSLGLEEIITNELGAANFEVRYLVALKQNVGNDLLEIGKAPVDNAVENIYRTSEELSVEGQEAEGYDKFSVCITGLDAQTYFDTVICVRPYIVYTDASGQEHILYGEQAQCSLYRGAKYIHDNTSVESDKDWLYENILSVTRGDNDEDADDIF